MALTEQQVFDKVVKHLQKQGVPAFSGGNCAYRGEGNMKCAIGCLITDREYKEEFENNGVTNIRSELPKRLRDLDIFFLEALQRVHDTTKNEAEVRRKLAKVADRYNLKFDPSKLSLPNWKW